MNKVIIILIFLSSNLYSLEGVYECRDFDNLMQIEVMDYYTNYIIYAEDINNNNIIEDSEKIEYYAEGFNNRIVWDDFYYYGFFEYKENLEYGIWEISKKGSGIFKRFKFIKLEEDK
ncbi:MAG: hypothetical protein PF693_14430 [Spirochaetia bacterium]|jgi:hypothetical protein|nr:hypothetical protein [Spirochaetia bacterium]